MIAPKIRSSKLKGEFYFTLCLTENEHYIVERLIREFCKDNGIDVVYYRKFKKRHIPMRRECKLRGDIYKFLDFAKEHSLGLQNYHRTVKAATKLFKSGRISYESLEEIERKS